MGAPAIVAVEWSMLQFLGTILSKVVDVLLKRVDLKKDQVGPLRFFELYIQLREILRGAKAIQHELKDSLSEDRHVPHIAMEIEAQAKRLEQFAGTIWGLLFYIEIFDRDTHRALEDIVGTKLQALTMYYELFEKIDSEHLVISEWRRDGVAARAARFRYLDIDELIEAGEATATRYDLRNADDVRALLNQCESNIGGIEAALNHLGDFIKANCDINDLFPKEAPFGWSK